jgi:hypothetical protein
MTRFARISTVFFLLSLIPGSMAQSQNNEPPVITPHRPATSTKPRPKPQPAAVKEKPTLLIICDLPCTLSLDGQSAGQAAGGGSVKTSVEAGQHAIVATSQDGLDTFSQMADVKETGQTVSLVALRPVHDARLLLEQQRQQSPIYQEEARKKAEQARLQELHQHADERNQQALTLRDQKKYFEARPLFEQACEGGNYGACLDLGVEYQYGQGGPKNMTRAMELYEQSCGNGRMQACYNAGNLYKEGDGVAQNNDRARLYYQQACDGGNADGCVGMGVLYDHGMGVTTNWNTAVDYFRKACDNNASWGCHDLAIHYENGQGIRADKAKARELYGKACTLGKSDSCEDQRRLQ